jgi:ATP-binding cassette, subfamily B, bacterial PglK|tara:strand:- start:18794 stop:20533 length:1740 start_codon:yes stop_codon:yes gene_type:complete
MIKKILYILDKNQKKRIYLLFFISLPLIFLETISIGSLPVYILAIVEPSTIIDYFNNDYLTNKLNGMSVEQRSFYGLLLIIIIFFIKALYNLFFNFYELSTLKKINLEHANKLYDYYLKQKILFFSENNPSKLIQNIDDIKRSTSVIFSIFNIFKESLIILMIFVMLIFASVKILLLNLAIFSLPIIFFLTFFRKSLKFRGEIAKKHRILKLKNLQESFSLMKFIKIIKGENFALNTFSQNNYRSTYQETILAFVTRLPRIILETFSVLAIALVVFFLFKSNLSFDAILPTLTLLVVGLIRFIPSIGSILVGLNQYKFHHVSLNNVNNIFKNIDNQNLKDQNKIETTEKAIVFNDMIELKDINFSYKDSDEMILKNINFKIKKNHKIGITGPSGSGKSTLLSICLGLVEPNNGQVLCDRKNIFNNLQGWHKSIGYVPQSIHLLDESIKNNICYGINEKEINEKNLLKAIEISEIRNFIDKQPRKLETWIGHNGARISGGQLQRIGIARAMYLNPTILILDEPTSSLDKNNEEQIINSLFSIKDITVILISHNTSVLKKCDQVLNLEDHSLENLVSKSKL